MTLQKLVIRPGVDRVSTPSGAQGRWTDMNLVRFVEGMLEPVGGWEKFIADQMTGKGRGVHAMVTSDQVRRLFIGTSKKLYMIAQGTIADITPFRESGTLGTDPFTTTSGSAVVGVGDTSHGLTEGDYVHYSGATAVGGITPSGAYTVHVLDGDNYQITHSSAASSGATGGGSAVHYDYEINTGFDDSIDAHGWGVGTYGDDTYGTPRTASVLLQCRTWTIDHIDDRMYCCPRGGGVYKYDLGDNRASALTNAPTMATGLFVTPERVVMTYGADTAMNMKWCDSLDDTIWTSDVNNIAGAQLLAKGSVILDAQAIATGQSIVLTDTDCYIASYTTDQLVYTFDARGNGAGAMGAQSLTVLNGIAYWWGLNDLMTYYGSLPRALPSRDIQSFVYGNMNRAQGSKFFAMSVAGQEEIWFFYVGTDTDPANLEIDSYAVFDMGDSPQEGYGFMNTGKLARTCGIDVDVFGNPTLVGADNHIYSHEIGADADGAVMPWYAESGNLYEIANGESDVEVLAIIPDFKFRTGTVELTLYVRQNPVEAEFTVGPMAIAPTDAWVEPRGADGKFLRMRLDNGSDLGNKPRMGVFRYDVQPSGQRF